jgi:ankyrin repeat protein
LRLDSHDDGYDVLDRSRLHIACALGAKDQYIPDLTLLPRFKWLHATMLGLDAFHIAAIHGNTHIFRAAAASGLDVLSYPQCFRASVYTRRNYIHWAAYLGHLELVQYLLELCEGKSNLIKDSLAYRDQWDNTVMHLAARNGHTDIVKVILPHVDWHQMRTRLRHTPFCAATTGFHLDIMKLLARFCNVDEDELGGLTPLAEASRQGFYEGVRYLLTLESVTLNSINSKGGKLKTPLDLALEGGHTECVEILKEHGALTRQDLGLMG